MTLSIIVSLYAFIAASTLILSRAINTFSFETIAEKVLQHFQADVAYN